MVAFTPSCARVPRATALAALALALVVSCAAAADAEQGTVVKVVDGDTIHVALAAETLTVRLIGIDTPELGRARSQVEEFAQEAASFVRERALGKSVRLERDSRGDTRDSYGRALRYVFLPDGTLLNAEIVSRGYGHAYTRFPFSRLEEFRGLERRAREEGLGLWSPERRQRLTDRQAADHVGHVATVCGDVVSTHFAPDVKGRPTFLNLGRPHPDQLLTVVIWGTDRVQFGAPEERYAGQPICVTGKIREYGGAPEIVADDPSQITIGRAGPG